MSYDDKNPNDPFAPPDPERFAPPALPEPATSLERGAGDSSAQTGETPTSGGPPPGPLPAEDTTIGTLGDEPMGGIPRDRPAPPAGAEGPAAPVPRRPPAKATITRVGEELFAWLKTLASAAVYATLIVTFGFQVARVEGQSMAPTLADQDRLIVNKLAYRIGQPQVGDIVMLYYPLNPEKSFVKRVIAEEGDQIRIVNGRVYRNDVPINDDYVPPEFRSHDDYGPEVVPQGYYFVMGDHRNNSSDSRHWKFVPKKYIIGKVQLRWWPIPAARIF
jgi:signal peptidase I